VDWQEKAEEDEQDKEFVALLRQFRPIAPPTFTTVRLRRLSTPTTLAIAAAIVLAFAIPVRLARNERASTVLNQGAGAPQTITGEAPTRVSQDNSSLGRTLHLIPSVETTLSAFAPPSTSEDRVDVALPAAPRRRVVTRAKPAYPPEAQRLGLEADVVLKLTVDRAGNVTETERIRGVVNLRPDEDNASARVEFYAANPYAFTLAAEAAAKQWRFETANSSMTCFAAFTFHLTTEPDLTRSTPSRPGSPTLSAVPGSARPGLLVPSAPPPVVPSGPIRVDGHIIKPPTRLVNINPVYPDDARAAHVEGVVILEITIGEDGSVVDARVLRSIPMLDQAAIDAVLQWVYDPPLLNGAPVEVQMIATINFALQ
jgi:protein TonB